MIVKPIRTDADLDVANARIREIFHAEEGTLGDDEITVLLDLVEAYETKTVDMGLPDPVSAIKFRMDQQGLTERDLVPLIGSHSRVSEVLSGKQHLTLSMARALHQNLGIPAEVLLQEPKAECPNTGLEFHRTEFPIK